MSVHTVTRQAWADAIFIRERLRPGEKYTTGRIGAGILEWPGSSVEVELRVSAALQALEYWGIVDQGWSQSDREVYWWLR